MYIYTRESYEESYMNTDDLAAELAKHEAVCEERWKTVFNQLKGIEERSAARFDSVEQTITRIENSFFSSVTRIETILIGAAGTIIVGGAGFLWTMSSFH